MTVRGWLNLGYATYLGLPGDSYRGTFNSVPAAESHKPGEWIHINDPSGVIITYICIEVEL